MSVKPAREAIAALRDPSLSLPAYGRILDQKTGQMIPYDPYVITKKLQATVVSYYSDTPRTDLGQTRWLNLLGYRQGGKSLTPEACGYVKAAYHAGFDHVCLHEDTLVRRADGDVRRVADITVGDSVLTHAGTLARVSKVWRRTVTDAVAVTVKGWNQPTVSSTDHPHFTRRGMVPAGKLRAGDELGHPVRQLECTQSDIWFPERGTRAHAVMPETVPASFEMGRVVGLYLAEGYARVLSRSGELNGVDFAVHAREVERTKAWLAAAGVPESRVTVRMRSGTNAAHVLVNSRQVAEGLVDLVGRTSGKHWPEMWEEFPREFVRGMVVGYLSGDGSFRATAGTHQVTVVGSSPLALALGARDAVASLWGLWGSTRLAPGKKLRGGGERQPAFYVTWFGAAARTLGQEVWGIEPAPMKRKSWRRKGSPYVDGKFAWLTVSRVEEAPAGEFVDVEVDHRDHSFSLVAFATSNCIADTKARAEYLHNRVHLIHHNWPKSVRSPTVPNREVRQLSFAAGGKMRILSGEAGAVGIGQSPDSFHGSELPYWRDAAGQFSLIYPSIINRDHALVCLESTAAPMSEPSAEWWKDQCHDSKLGLGRWIYAFFPFWDGVLNARPWPKGSRITQEEMRLLDKYGGKGLTRENLAFRRLMMETDPVIRRFPALFRVYYPFDDLSCWMASAGSVFRQEALDRHQTGDLVAWTGPYQEYEAPEPGAVYAIGADPAGFAARDHASFQVLKCLDGELTQVAVFGSTTDPVEFADKLYAVGMRYNRALVGVESNGVGAAVLALLIKRNYKNLFYEKAYTPGIAATTKSLPMMLAGLQDAVMDTLILRDEDTVDQLGSYGEDKAVERSASSEILGAQARGKRRKRHHWDKVSALQVAVYMAKKVPRRFKPEPPKDLGNVVLFGDMTYDQLQEYRGAGPKKSRTSWPRARYPKPKR